MAITTIVSAGEVMDRVSMLLNDPNKTDYTYAVMVPYVNMAIDELSEALAETNSSPSQGIWGTILKAGEIALWQADNVQDKDPQYPNDLVEVQEIKERPWRGFPAGSTQDPNPYEGPLTRLEVQPMFPPTDRLRVWYWEDQAIKFNAYGATIDIDIQLEYIRRSVPYVVDENSKIYIIHSRSYLAYKTAALCALFIGENETRAQVLEDQATKAIERTINISSKGKQQIMTRHRPFRANYKMRGGY